MNNSNTQLATITSTISANNGMIDSYTLATALGKTHQNFVAKLTTYDFHESLKTAEMVYTTGNGTTKTRTVYGLPEKEAMAMAMSYNVEIGMIVYEAFKTYEAALIKVASSGSIEEAKEIALTTLETAVAKAIQNNREGKLIGKQVSKALQESLEQPLEMIETLKTISAGMDTVKTGNGREGYWLQARRMVEGLRDTYRTTAKVFDMNIFAQYEQVTHYCTKRIAQVRK